MLKINIISFVCLFAFSISALAQNEKQSSEIDACKTQVDLFCAPERDKKDLRALLMCLGKNHDSLSTECKQEFQRITQAARQTNPQPGGGPLSAIGGLAGPGAQVPSLTYEGSYAPGRNNTHTPEVSNHNVNLSFPVYRSPENTVALSLGAGQLHMNTPVTLSSGLEVPTDFYRTELGLQYSKVLPEQKVFGLRATYGYTADKMTSGNESYSFMMNYSFSKSEAGRWVLMLMFSNNSPLGEMIPIPGFIYIYRTPTFTGLFGVPILSLQWTPVNPWSYSFSLFGPTITTEAAYGAVDQAQYFTGLNWKQQRYIMSQRLKEDDRLTVEEKNFELGVRKPLYKSVFSDARAGYAFERKLYAGEKLFNSDSGKAQLADSAYFKLSLRAGF